MKMKNERNVLTVTKKDKIKEKTSPIFKQPSTEPILFRIRVSVVGGSINKTTELQSYQKIGKVLARANVFLLTGPSLEGTYIKEIMKGFLEENQEIKKRIGISGGTSLELIPEQRISWVKESKKRIVQGEKKVAKIEGGLPQLTAILERPTVSLFIIFPPSSSSLGTMAEAAQILSHLEVAIKTGKRAQEKPEEAIPYPCIPKAVFIDWEGKDKAIIEEQIEKSKILSSKINSGTQDIIQFLSLEGAIDVLPRLIAKIKGEKDE